jgi:isocitrate dehydrogenase kinase/phosphatase
MAAQRPEGLAASVLSAYEAYVQEFHAITRRAPARFEARDWTGSVQDGLARLRLYKQHIDGFIERHHESLGADGRAPELWEEARAIYRRTLAGQYDTDLALMFVDSVLRRALAPATVVPYGSDGVDPQLDERVEQRVRRGYAREPGRSLELLVSAVLEDCRFGAPWRDLAGDARCCAEAIVEGVAARGGTDSIASLEVLRSLFYRNKGAYLVGRIRMRDGGLMPLTLALGHLPQGIVVDAVLTEESDLRRIFSYTRSNFHVELEGQYREVLSFLRSVMPHKNWAALYSSIGFMNPAKIQLSQDLEAHRRQPGTKLRAAWGIPGLVMVVFASAGFPYVFKVIRDDDKVAKSGYIGRERVREKYRLVQEGDRVGRLLDTITFHHLRFARDDFEPKILRELLDAASASVHLVGDDVVVTHCYAQREATPLPIYLRQHDWPEIERVLNDLGACLKQIAAAGLFPGEFDLKNFGVAEDGRVVFFDFDGLDELGRFAFDDVPLAASLGQEECFEYLLHEYRVNLVEAFRELHPDLFTSEHWQAIQRLLRAGEVLDTFPYPAHKRLEYRRARASAASRRGPVALPAAVEQEMERLGLRSAHRKGLIVWEPRGDGVAIGLGDARALNAGQRQAVRQAFAVEEADLRQRAPGVIVVDGLPAFVFLPDVSTRVLDLSRHYTAETALAGEWRERVQREVFRGVRAEFCSPARAASPR